MNYPMVLKQWFDHNNADRGCAQKLLWDYDGFKGRFNVSDLCECPEDAIIGRDLFDAWDFIHAVEFGIHLGYLGYENVDVQEKVVEEEGRRQRYLT